MEMVLVTVLIVNIRYQLVHIQMHRESERKPLEKMVQIYFKLTFYSVLNEFGNPVNVNPSQSSQQNLQQQQLMNQMNQQIPQYAGPVVNPNYISTSGGLAPENRDADGFSHRLQQLMVSFIEKGN